MTTMMRALLGGPIKGALLGATALSAVATFATAEAHATTITVATVNNGDMIRMQGLMDEFNAEYPDITVEWVTLEENILRQNVTTDIATSGGQYDVVTIGTYEVPIWGANGWLMSLNDLPAEWDVDDILPAIRGGLTVDGELYAAPFYGEIVDGHVPHRPDGGRRPRDAGRADMGIHPRSRCRDDRPRQQHLRHLCPW